MYNVISGGSRRDLRGLRILTKGGQIHKLSDGIFSVNSESSSIQYKVVWVANKYTCNCADFVSRLKKCKHICAVEYFLLLPSIMSANGYAA